MFGEDCNGIFCDVEVLTGSTNWIQEKHEVRRSLFQMWNLLEESSGGSGFVGACAWHLHQTPCTSPPTIHVHMQFVDTRLNPFQSFCDTSRSHASLSVLYTNLENKQKVFKTFLRKHLIHNRSEGLRNKRLTKNQPQLLLMYNEASISNEEVNLTGKNIQ